MQARLGVNIDHVATLRNARGGLYPDPVQAALLAAEAGADGITAHLREDRRHIRDDDIVGLMRDVRLPLNLEMAATEEMIAIACALKPNAVCLVPEKREERTTEGGLDVARQQDLVARAVGRLREANIRVSLFINPDDAQVEAAARVGAQVVELHTGIYCETNGAAQAEELDRLREAATRANREGLECHAGHGLTFATVQAVAAIPEVAELNIGHFLIADAVFEGLKASVARMKRLMREAR